MVKFERESIDIFLEEGIPAVVFFKRLNGSEEMGQYNYNEKSKNREKKQVILSPSDSRDKSDSGDGVVCTARNSKSKNQLEEKLNQSEERLGMLLEFAPDGYYLSDLKGVFLDVNRSAEEIIGYKKEELIGGSFLKLKSLSPDQILKTSSLLAKNALGVSTGPDEFFLRRKDGCEVPVEIRTFPVKTSGGTVVLGIVRDISDQHHLLELVEERTLKLKAANERLRKEIRKRKKAEEEREKLQARLVQSEKMVGVGTLARGVAHEFNNLLQIMRGTTEFAHYSKKSEDIDEALVTVLNTSDKAAKIMRDLLSFSSPAVSEKEPCNVTELIESALSLTEGQLNKQNISVVRNYQKVPLIEVNRAEVQQVFFNMIVNVREAMVPKGGVLKIYIEQVQDKIEVNFCDTGKGIEKADLNRVFESFYTTKRILGEEFVPGTGLGLFVSYGIIKRHGGTIEVRSEATKGTIITIKFPVKSGSFQKKPRKIRERREIKEIPPKNILIVDDEEEICKMLMKFLSEAGHRARYVLSGKEAIERVKMGDPDVVLLDLIMPGIPGIEVLDEINRISKKTRVVVMTGRVIEKDFLKKIKQRGASSCLLKPFDLNDINTALSPSM